VDNEFFVSGSQDSTLALWHVRNELEGRFYDDDIDNNNIKLVRKYVNPLLVGSCRLEKDIRAIVFDKHSKNIISLSTFGFIHIWNVEHFTQVISCIKNIFSLTLYTKQRVLKFSFFFHF